MEQLNENARIDQELEQARRDLRDTLEQVNHKVEQAEALFRPQAIIRSNPVALSLLAGLFGYVAGHGHRLRPLRWVVIGALLGVTVAVSHRGRHNRSDGTS